VHRLTRFSSDRCKCFRNFVYRLLMALYSLCKKVSFPWIPFRNDLLALSVSVAPPVSSFDNLFLRDNCFCTSYPSPFSRKRLLIFKVAGSERLLPLLQLLPLRVWKVGVFFLRERPLFRCAGLPSFMLKNNHIPVYFPGIALCRRSCIRISPFFIVCCCLGFFSLAPNKGNKGAFPPFDTRPLCPHKSLFFSASLDPRPSP